MQLLGEQHFSLAFMTVSSDHFFLLLSYHLTDRDERFIQALPEAPALSSALPRG
jgi:hypothetical protein